MPITTAAELFSPSTVDTFIDRYLEKEVFHLQRNDPSVVEGIFDLDSMGACLRYAQPARTNSIRVIPNGEGPEETAYYQQQAKMWQDSESAMESVFVQAFADKKTLVFVQSELFWEPVRRIVQSVRQALQTDVKCNIYCTPPMAQGSGTHVDSHDVLVLQAQGTKIWRMYEVKDQLPLDYSEVVMKCGARLATSRPRHGRPTFEVTLEPGDLLYLPRGVPHSAASQGEASVHLTVGLYPLRWHRFFGMLIDLIARKEMEIRRRVPVQVLRGETPLGSAGDLLRGLADMADGLEAPVDPNIVARMNGEDYGYRGGTQGMFFSAAHAEETNLNSRVARPEGVRFWTRRNESEIVIHCGGSMSVPLKVEPMIPFLTEHRSFRVGDLPDVLTDSAKVVLVRKMITNGLLHFVSVEEPGSPGDDSPSLSGT